MESVNLVKKNGLFLGMEEVPSKKTGEIFVILNFCFDTETIRIFDNADRELWKQISTQGLKAHDKCIVEGELKLRRGEKNNYWNYSIKTIKKF